MTHLLLFFFSIWVFFHNHSRITGLQGKGEGICLTPHYHFHQSQRHLDISRTITAESSPLHIASRTCNGWTSSEYLIYVQFTSYDHGGTSEIVMFIILIVIYFVLYSLSSYFHFPNLIILHFFYSRSNVTDTGEDTLA